MELSHFSLGFSTTRACIFFSETAWIGVAGGFSSERWNVLLLLQKAKEGGEIEAGRSPFRRIYILNIKIK